MEGLSRNLKPVSSFNNFWAAIAPSNSHFTKKKTLGVPVETEWEISYDQLTTTRAF